MNVKNLTRGLIYRGEAEGKRQTYYVFEGYRFFFVISFSRTKSNAGNFNIVESEAVEYVRKTFAGEKGLTANDIVARARKPQYIKDSLDVLNILYVLAATKQARVDRRYKSRELYFNIKQA